MTDVSGILNGVDRWSTADLIGRQAERTRLRDALSQAEAGQVRAVLVAGAAWDTALQMGARLLQDKIQALATRAHVTVGKTARTDSPTRLLTRREHEVMALLGTGSTNRQIANQLFISEKTASVHVSNILAKLGVENRGQAVAEAIRRGLL